MAEDGTYSGIMGRNHKARTRIYRRVAKPTAMITEYVYFQFCGVLEVIHVLERHVDISHRLWGIKGENRIH